MGCASGPGALRRAIQWEATPGLRGGHCSRASLSDIPDGAPLSFIGLSGGLAALGGGATAATPAYFETSYTVIAVCEQCEMTGRTLRLLSRADLALNS